MESDNWSEMNISSGRQNGITNNKFLQLYVKKLAKGQRTTKILINVVRDLGWLKIISNDEENDSTVQVKR